MPQGLRAPALPEITTGLQPEPRRSPRAGESWCRRGDSNPHGLPHTPLKRARLPVPPLRRRAYLAGRPRALSRPRGVPGSETASDDGSGKAISPCARKGPANCGATGSAPKRERKRAAALPRNPSASRADGALFGKTKLGAVGPIPRSVPTGTTNRGSACGATACWFPGVPGSPGRGAPGSAGAGGITPMPLPGPPRLGPDGDCRPPVGLGEQLARVGEDVLVAEVLLDAPVGDPTGLEERRELEGVGRRLGQRLVVGVEKRRAVRRHDATRFASQPWGQLPNKPPLVHRAAPPHQLVHPSQRCNHSAPHRVADRLNQHKDRRK